MVRQLLECLQYVCAGSYFAQVVLTMLHRLLVQKVGKVIKPHFEAASLTFAVQVLSLVLCNHLVCLGSYYALQFVPVL